MLDLTFPTLAYKIKIIKYTFRVKYTFKFLYNLRLNPKEGKSFIFYSLVTSSMV